MRDVRPVLALPRAVLSRGANVILDVTAAENAARVHILKARKNVRGALSRNVHHYVQAAAMAHADHCLFGAHVGCGSHHAVEQRNQRRHALQRKSLAAEIARLQNLLEQVGANQALENIGAVGLSGLRLHSSGDPAATFGIVNMKKFHADRAAIKFSRGRGSRTIVDEFGMLGGRKEAQRIKVRGEISPAPVTFKYALDLRAFFLDCLRYHGDVPWALLAQRKHSTKHAADAPLGSQIGAEPTIMNCEQVASAFCSGHNCNSKPP